MGIGRAIGFGFCVARDAVARFLIRFGVAPNTLTLTGAALTAGAGVCYAIGAGTPMGWSIDPHAPANAFLPLAGALIILASACDMLDGAVAKLGKQSSTFGAFLDSTLDRYSDFAVYAGIAIYYVCHPPVAQPFQAVHWGAEGLQNPAVLHGGNATFAFLAMLAFFNGFMISYTRARAEDIIPACRVGYWQRGERSAAILIATFAGNIPALLVQQAASPLFTVLRRMMYTYHVLAGKPAQTDPSKGNWLLQIRLWRWPRMTWQYDLVTAINIAWLIFVPIQAVDVFRTWAGR
jgi:phosphatidylglycerophosphate synthase